MGTRFLISDANFRSNETSMVRLIFVVCLTFTFAFGKPTMGTIELINHHGFIPYGYDLLVLLLPTGIYLIESLLKIHLVRHWILFVLEIIGLVNILSAVYAGTTSFSQLITINVENLPVQIGIALTVIALIIVIVQQQPLIALFIEKLKELFGDDEDGEKGKH